MFGKTINHLETLVEFGHQLVDFFRRMLQVVVHRHQGVEPGRPNAAEERIVLSVISHQVDSAHPVMLRGEPLYHPPALVPAAVIDQHQFVFARRPGQHRLQALDQFRQRQFAVIDWNDDRDRGPRSIAG